MFGIFETKDKRVIICPPFDKKLVWKSDCLARKLDFLKNTDELNTLSLVTIFKHPSVGHIHRFSLRELAIAGY